MDKKAISYCRNLRIQPKWGSFFVPVLVNSNSNEVFRFRKSPMWGRIYYPHFRKLIDQICVG
jgi:hypothetical protein